MWLIGLFLALGVVLGPLGAQAQPSGKVWRIGMLETTSPTLNVANLDAFRQGLRDLGYVEGQNFVIEYRSADGRPERFPALATELVSLKVDVIVTRGTPAVLAAKKASGSIPIVMATSADPPGYGVVSSLAHPGGNVTGLTTIAVELAGKRLQLLRETLPRIARVAELANMTNPASAANWRQLDVTARSLGLEPQLLDVRHPEDFPRAFDAATKQRADALVVANDTLTQSNLRRIVDLSATIVFPRTMRRESLWTPAASLRTAPSRLTCTGAPRATSTRFSKGPSPQTYRSSNPRSSSSSSISRRRNRSV